MSGNGNPVLWHIPVSHYSEKARWALAYKDVEHDRHVAPAGTHPAVALALTRGQCNTFPVLRLEGRNIGDSTAIIAALEELKPDPPLYPADPDERRRALELEEWFDEHLGPQLRLYAWHEFVMNQAHLESISLKMAPALRRFPTVAAQATRAFVSLRFKVSSREAAEQAKGDVLKALDRLESELGDSEYLAGDSFSVADLTAAALFYPLALPPEGPQQISDPPDRYEQFRAPLKERPGFRWIEEMYRRHRRPAAVATSS
ncbi:MAG: glutathione S-transferase family protein [Thermoleophilaceae bacterium]